MKQLRVFFTVALFSAAFWSCDALYSVASNDVTAQGAPYELIVVCEQQEWEGALGDTLRKVLTAPIPYLLQTEPQFDILRVTARGYENLVTRHRNILRCVISPQIDSTAVAVQYNVHATPQIILTLQGPSESALTEYVSKNQAKLVEVLESSERERALAYARRFNVASLEQIIRNNFNMEMKIPAGYTLRNEKPDFLWMSYEYPHASQGVIIYTYPATKGIRSLAPEEILAARNKYTAMVPGPSKGSYMTTYSEEGYVPDFRTFRREGRLWAEMRGFWDVHGDYMGGPFVSYSTIDTATGCVVTIDCYVFSPKNPKRNYMRGVEHLLYSVSFNTEDK